MNRRFALMAALLVTLATTGWLALQPDDEAQPAVAALVAPVEKRRPASPTPGPAARQPHTPARPVSAWGTPAPGAVAAWAAPATVQAALPASAPERSAPPRFPYTWIGRVDDGASVQALLNGPQRSFGVRAGEVLDGRWRVEAIAATRLQLTWLPTGEAVNVDAR